MFNRYGFTLCLAASLGSTSSFAQTTVDFDGLAVPTGGFVNGGPLTSTTIFNVDGVEFGNSFTDFGGGFTGWNGFSFSNVNNTATAGFGNQYAAFTGTDFSGTGNYAVSFGASEQSYINLPDGQVFSSVYATATTYSALSMLNGDSFAKQFGGVDGNDPDFFSVIFTGYDGEDANGNITGTVEFFLADYRFADNSQDFIIDTWELVDLTSLGDARSLGLSYTSSDVGGFGINTPTYVALDNLSFQPIPEPASLALVALGGIIALSRRR
ncbi:MAG: DUF4465 domain-containing protein [Planctomycetota bacterium]